MRFKEIIKENLSAEKIFNKYFRTDGFIKYLPDGIDVEYDIFLKEEVAETITELPLKFNEVGGIFSIDNASALKNLNNFPKSVGFLNILGVPALTKLISNTGDISCSNFFLSNAPVADFVDSSIVLAKESSLTLNTCSKLTSIAGLRFENIKDVRIVNCPMFVDDLGKNSNIREIFIQGISSNDMPLINGFISRRLRFLPDATSETAMIYKKYYSQGPDQVMALIRELRAAGFKNAARI